MFETFKEEMGRDKAYESAKTSTANQIQVKLMEISHTPGKDLFDHTQEWVNMYGGEDGPFRIAFNELCAEYEDLVEVWNPDLPVLSSSELSDNQSRLKETPDREKIIDLIIRRMEEVRTRQEERAA